MPLHQTRARVRRVAYLTLGLLLLTGVSGCGRSASSVDAARSTTTTTLAPCTTDVGAPDVHAMMGPEAGEHDMDGLDDMDMSGQTDCVLAAGKQDILDKEISRSRQAVAPYPQLSDALTEGWFSEVPASPHVDGAVHLYKADRIDDRFDIDEPEMLLYPSNAPDARIEAVVYFVLTEDTTPPAGFTGPNDRWHRHVPEKSACVVDGAIHPEIVGDTACAAAGGAVETGGTGWMLHVWSLPGAENPAGLFSINKPQQ